MGRRGEGSRATTKGVAERNRLEQCSGKQRVRGRGRLLQGPLSPRVTARGRPRHQVVPQGFTFICVAGTVTKQ